jgi:hypothetical protein
MRRVSVPLISAKSVVAFTRMASAADFGQPVYEAPPPQPPPLAGTITTHTHFTDNIVRAGLKHKFTK